MLTGAYEAYLRTGEGSWRVDLSAARWAPADEDFDQIDAVAGELERRLRKMSVADDGMSA